MIWRRTKLDTLGDIQVFLWAVSKHGKVHPKIKIKKRVQPKTMPSTCKLPQVVVQAWDQHP